MRADTFCGKSKTKCHMDEGQGKKESLSISSSHFEEMWCDFRVGFESEKEA